MRYIFSISVLVLLCSNLFAQFKSITYESKNDPSLEIVQIDFLESSTLIHFQITCTSLPYLCFIKDAYVYDKNENIKYTLLNSFNLPMGEKYHEFTKIGENLNFSLEFQKMPKSISTFDIIEYVDSTDSITNTFNFYNIKIDTSKHEVAYLDMIEFWRKTPVREIGVYYKNGNAIQYYIDKGITISALLTNDKIYYKADISIHNGSGREIVFNPSTIKLRITKKNKITIIPSRTYNEFMKKTRNDNLWLSVAVGIGELSKATNAGYSSSTTYSKSNTFSNTTGSIYGNIDDTYFRVYGRSSSFSTTYSTSTTITYDKRAAYLAMQTANYNMALFQQQQAESFNYKKNNYLNLNTIEKSTNYGGFVIIPYKRADLIELLVSINGQEYKFTYE